MTAINRAVSAAGSAEKETHDILPKGNTHARDEQRDEKKNRTGIGKKACPVFRISPHIRGNKRLRKPTGK